MTPAAYAPVMRTLLTWTDRAPGAPHHIARPEDRGPVRRLIAHAPPYDRVLVLTTAAALPGARQLTRDLGRIASLRLVDLDDPSDHEALFRGLEPLVAELRGQRVDVLLSAGTPQAQTIWVLLVQSGLLDGRMLQVIPPRFVPDPHPEPVRVVDLAIDGFPEVRALREQVRRLRAERRPAGLVGTALDPVLRRIQRLAPSEVPVWIRGETGTGKELVARALHDVSSRAEGPFVPVNAGAFAEGVLASELFGHAQGAFTGAVRPRRGLFEQADGGTLFLDEVGELPPRVQVHLLRVLETGEIRPVGAERTRQVDVRVVCATHRDLRTLPGFRQDLFYRLCGAEIALPPLRERGGDLELLVAHFDTVGHTVSPAAWEALRRHPWPGNVRELRAEVARWAWLTDGTVELADLSPSLRGVERVTASEPDRERTLAEQVEEVERAAVAAALRRAEGNQSAAARALGIDRNTLRRKLRRYGLRWTGTVG